MTATVKLWRVVRVTASFVFPIVWVAAGAAVARLGAEVLSAIPLMGKLFVGMVSLVFGLGGLWVFWVVADRIGFELRGYRVRQLGPKGYFIWTLGPKDCRY